MIPGIQIKLSPLDICRQGSGAHSGKTLCSARGCLCRRVLPDESKNTPTTGTGVEDPWTSRRDLLVQHYHFVEVAGTVVEEGVEVKLLPLVMYAGEGLVLVNGKMLSASVVE